MIKIVKKSSGEYILGCGAVETKVAPLKLREISRKNVKGIQCGLIHNIPFYGEMEVRLAS